MNFFHNKIWYYEKSFYRMNYFVSCTVIVFYMHSSSHLGILLNWLLLW